MVTNFFNRRLGFGGSVQVLAPSDLAGGILDERAHAGRSPAATTPVADGDVPPDLPYLFDRPVIA